MDTRTLGELLDTLGEPALRLLTAPSGLTAPVAEVLLYDAHAPFPDRAPGALLLAVGVRADAAGALVDAAAAARMAGLVVRGEEGASPGQGSSSGPGLASGRGSSSGQGPGPGLADAVARARERGLALLTVDEDAAWHHVHLLLAGAVGARPSPADGAALGDLFSLAGAVATAVGGATVIEDPRQRILAHSTIPGQPVDEPRRQGILGRQVPGSPENTEQYRVLFASQGPVRLPALSAEELPRLAVAVRAGGETLGSLWVVDDGTLAADAEEALAQGASTAALLLLRARAAQELSRHMTGDLLRRLLDGTAEPATAAERLGLAPGTPVRVAAFALEGAAGAPDGEQAALRLLDLVRLQCEARYGRHACVLVDGVVYALLPVADGRAGERQRRLAEDIVRRAGQALRVPVRAGLGDVVPEVAAVRGSREDADLVLRVLGPDETVAAMAEVRARAVLLRLTELLGERRELAAGAWRDIVAYDAGHGTDYARTLVCWLDAGCDMARAARLLAVHPNTCRYRLRQARTQLGIDLDDPDERLVLWLQLRTLAGLRSAGV
ncbi:PucR family transcriptional regulator [Streptomyces rhizosphaericus]|uniref:PucR family transcriptional regulator n=1 Tax=Streptomyces rhizosphaericus TaxID=114699 RepID=A0A6G4A9J5_9ACTN|nr:helix-turn-helix domain-containing protein [Streptomyces rhizosphaericus]NEW69369.1 PucR family transcriptional regulator [Streptomyces rhizosphaericus]